MPGGWSACDDALRATATAVPGEACDGTTRGRGPRAESECVLMAPLFLPAGHRPGTGAHPVVLEAGLGASSLGWSRVADELGAVVRVLRYDRAGLGAALPRAGGRGLGRLADDLLDVIADAGAEPVVLVGHSWGASVVRLVADRRPDVVAGL